MMFQTSFITSVFTANSETQEDHEDLCVQSRKGLTTEWLKISWSPCALTSKHMLSNFKLLEVEQLKTKTTTTEKAEI